MNKICFIFAGLSLFCIAQAQEITYEIAQTDKIFYGVPANPNTGPIPGKDSYFSTSHKEGIGNGGNTKGVGTDHGGGNGHVNKMR